MDEFQDEDIITSAKTAEVWKGLFMTNNPANETK